MVLLAFGRSMGNELSHFGSHVEYGAKTSSIVSSNKFIMIEKTTTATTPQLDFNLMSPFKFWENDWHNLPK